MILNPDVAAVLDKAAENVSEVDVMPTRLFSRGNAKGDHGYDALTAVCRAMIDLDFMDEMEMESFGQPHLAEIMTVVADFGTVPECDRENQDMRFEAGGYPMNNLLRRARRADDVVMWSRGRQASEVAQLFRWAAEEFRSRPANEGIYPTEGTYEVPASRGGAFLAGIRMLAREYGAGNPHGQLPTMAVMAMIEAAFQEEPSPDPELSVVVKTEDVAAARIAEIAQGVIDLITELGWTDTYLFNPQTGAVSIRGAAGLVVDLPPRIDYMSSPLHRLERRWAELWAFDTALADFLGLPVAAVECRACGGSHGDDRMAPWENADGRTVEEIVAAVTGLRDAYVAVASQDSVGVEEVDWDNFQAMLGQSTD